ncbi:MAG TPA: aminotransferase class I/II-fold pyridoxal phosphate-dependent enzyme, partial [Eudoraea sp.]|nr:aminotransferase class I/II-fold pyridoxal phosphate-dependent enzyme [Eudoraea sp.]
MTFHPDFNIVAKALHQFYADSVNADQPVVHQQEPAQIISELKLEHYVREGGLEAGALKEFLETYFSYVTRLHHPHYLGHQCAPPHYASALGTFITGFANTVSSIYEMGPASVSIEFFVLNWMLEKIGWDPVPNDRITKDTGISHGGGILVNGGSIANLTALLIARTRAYPGVWQEGCPADLAIMLPSESHYSLTKAAGILGIGSKAVFHLASDKQGKVLPDKIPEILKKITDNGQIPMALVANACSTPVGMYDPLEEIGEICNEHGVWFHVDGAHGASALISEKHKG